MQLSTHKSIPAWIVAAFLVLSFIGFLDASYLTVKHFTGVVPPCLIGGGCEEVTTSRFATIFGIPVALLGALYYLTVFLGTIAFVDKQNVQILRRVSALTLLGLIASIYFMFLQAFVIDAYCTYCVGSAITSTLLFVLGSFTMHKIRRGWQQTETL